MEEERKGRTAAAFLQQYKFMALMFLTYLSVAALIFSLYRVETEAVWYAAGLCLLITAVVLPVKFHLYRKSHQERQWILKNILLAADKLPEPKTLEEWDYQEMIRSLQQICEENQTAWQNERQESVDYYTTWVHQIKSPISVMRMILQGEDTEEHRELSVELFRIEQYVDMVLSYLRLGSETSDFVFQEYLLDDIIRQAVHKYAPQFVRKRVRLIYEPSKVSVLTDEKWLLFIIEQLLSNAVKYTIKGAITISVSEDKVLKIADTGIGIASEDIPRIFEKGFTGYNGRADKKATGLGLYLCRMAADRLSHKISVQSKAGEGTAFFVDLNVKRLDTRE